MREIGHHNEFDLIVNIFTSFGYFEHDEDNEKVIMSISESLKTGGYLLLDFLNADFLPKSLVPFNIKKYNGKVVVQIRNIKDNFVIKDILILKNAPGEEAPAYNHYKERIRLFTIEDFDIMFRKYGLNIINTFGDYEGNKFDKSTSRRLILLAQKL
jgi:SAM-dependent methyltransferase